MDLALIVQLSRKAQALNALKIDLWALTTAPKLKETLHPRAFVIYQSSFNYDGGYFGARKKRGAS